MKMDHKNSVTTQKRPAVRAKLMWWLSHCPFFLTAIAIASVNVVLFALMFFQVVDKDLYPRLLKPLLFPGFSPLYVLGTIFNSLIVGWIGFVVGMFVVYGLVGLMFDLLLLGLKLRRKRMKNRE